MQYYFNGNNKIVQDVWHRARIYLGCSATLTTNCRVNPNCITVISSVPVAFSAVIAY